MTGQKRYREALVLIRAARRNGTVLLVFYNALTHGRSLKVIVGRFASLNPDVKRSWKRLDGKLSRLSDRTNHFSTFGPTYYFAGAEPFAKRRTPHLSPRQRRVARAATGFATWKPTERVH